MSNYNPIFNIINKNSKQLYVNQFIINQNNIQEIKNESDILIDYNVMFNGIIQINKIDKLQHFINDLKQYDFKVFVLKNYLFYKKNIENLSILSEIIFDNFNIKNKEISYIYKFLSKNKNKKNFIEIIISKFLNYKK